MLRIVRTLEEIEKYDPLTQEDMYEIYDFLIKGNNLKISNDKNKIDNYQKEDNQIENKNHKK